MIVVTGAAGFIGSCFLQQLNLEGKNRIVIVDDFTRPCKRPNYSGKQFARQIDRNEFPAWLDQNGSHVRVVFHLGARTDTTETQTEIFETLNLEYSRKLFVLCTRHGIPFLYASSAATYGNGESGYDDDPALIPRLRPMNPYGISKNEFDRWALQQSQTPPCWYGFKFFNVYGPNEYHKGRMASVVYHACRQIMETGHVRLFRSHKPGIGDGMQARDFIYVKDVLYTLLAFYHQRPASGIYNLGTGTAGTFLQLVHAVFEALGRKPSVEFIDTPADIRDTYQYFTCAETARLRSAASLPPFTSLSDGVKEYVSQYLVRDLYF